MKETHMMLVAFWRTLVKIVVVSQHKRRRNKSFSRFCLTESEADTDSDLKVHALHYANEQTQSFTGITSRRADFIHSQREIKEILDP